MLLAKPDGSMWLKSEAGISLLPTCPPSLYLETSWSQSEVCSTHSHPTGHGHGHGHGDADSVPPPSSPLVLSHMYRGRACPGWPDNVCSLLSCKSRSRTPNGLRVTPHLSHPQGLDNSLLLLWAGVGAGGWKGWCYLPILWQRMRGLHSALIHPSIRLALGCLKSPAWNTKWVPRGSCFPVFQVRKVLSRPQCACHLLPQIQNNTPAVPSCLLAVPKTEPSLTAPNLCL